MKQSPSKQSEASSENDEHNKSISYPNVVTDDDKKHKDKDASPMRGHSARTA